MLLKKIGFSVLKICLVLGQRFFPKDVFILFDNLYEKNAECIDTYCIFKYMRQRNMRAYYVIWAENPLYKQLVARNDLDNIIVLKKSSKKDKYELFFKSWIYLFRTKAVLTSFGSVSGKITKFFYRNKYITYINVDHGCVLLKAGVLESGHFSPKKFNKFLVASDLEEEIFTRYGWQKENLIKLGLPRWDHLVRIYQQQKTIFVMFTWRHSFATWNEEKFKTPLTETEYYKGIRAFLYHERLHALLKRHNIKLVYTLHHSMLNQCVEAPDFSSISYVPAEKISHYIGSSDLFVTDYSSLFFDFAFLNTPVVFYRPDFHDMTLVELDRMDLENARSQDARLFNACYDAEEAISCIERYIHQDFILEKENQEKLSVMFSTKENITQKLVTYLMTEI